jgi:hypothetical protein
MLVHSWDALNRLNSNEIANHDICTSNIVSDTRIVYKHVCWFLQVHSSASFVLVLPTSATLMLGQVKNVNIGRKYSSYVRTN